MEAELHKITVQVRKEKPLKHLLLSALMILCGLAIIATESRAGGHFVPGVYSIRDYVVPDPGFYSALYNYYYKTNQLNDNNGNKIESVSIGPKKKLRLRLT